MVSFYDQIAANKRNSYIILFIAFLLSFIAIYAFSIVLFGGNELSIIISTIFAIGYLAITYTISDSLILSVSGAREAKKEEYPYLVNVVEGLSIAAGIPTPKIYVIDDPSLNAFAVGKSPDRAAVAFTTGLLNNLNRAELEGVVAHEISHIRNYDSRMATIAIGMVGLIAILSEVGLRGLFWGRGQSRRGGGGILVLIGLLILILAPILAQLVRLALSRQREYLADASGAQLTRYPEGLASALEKIKKLGSHVQKASDTTAPLYIANPLSVGSLFSTHPPIDERIRILREM
ncbi:MAG: M48 family metalloprotease [Candidatus Micrarchaeota archaeon]|nr:M48 family metalloprotease [Candidatus Micrarchaeota archaeon]